MRASTCLAICRPTVQQESTRKTFAKVGTTPRIQNQRLSTVTRPYTFHIGVSWAGKPHRNSDSGFKIPFPSDGLIGSWRDQTLARPKAIKSTDAGEDFFFVQEMQNGSGVAFGVADGVSGWVENGVDPSLFSQALMYHAQRYSRNAWAGEPEIDPTLDYEEQKRIEGWEMTPYECIGLAYHGVLREKMVLAGSSTACIISLNTANGILQSANLGDSGFAIIRSSSIFYRQRTQTHSFNCPKQLTKLPSNAGRFSGVIVDAPSDADTFQTKLRDGDIVVAYVCMFARHLGIEHTNRPLSIILQTDGFSDNVFPSEMATICRLVARSGGSEDTIAQAMADRMVDYSQLCMRSRTRVSPFERDAAREGMFFRGGKEDDVTIVVGLVRETT